MTGTRELGEGGRGGGARDPRVQKQVHSCLKALFCFPERS